MKKIAVPYVFVLLALSACSSGGPNAPRPQAPAPQGPGTEIALTDADRTAVETAIRARLGQPSTTFRTMIGQRNKTGAVVVCGYFNSGSGDTPFIGTLGNGAFAVTDLGGERERTIAVQRACHGRRIYI